jgi:glycosyltransferase involved in cell wall biosynthesis
MTKIRFYSNFPLEFMGGGERTGIALANHFGAEGHDVEYISDLSYSGIERIGREEVSDFVRHFRYSREHFRSYSALTAGGMLARRLPGVAEMHQDVVHIILIDRVPPATFLALLKERGLRVLFLCFGLALDSRLPPDPAAATFQIYQRTTLALFAVLRNAPNVHFQVLSILTKERLRSLGIPRERIHFIPSGVEPMPDASPIDDELFRILFIGRMEKVSKGLRLLSQVLDRLEELRLPDALISVVGSGKDAGVVARRQRSNRVEFLGFVSEREKATLLRRTQVLLVTSFLEPYSLVVAEGLMAGAFVLSSPASGPSSIVLLNEEYGKVLPYNPDEFVRNVVTRYRLWKQSSDHLISDRLARRNSSAEILSEKEMFRKYDSLLLEFTRRVPTV